MRVQSHKITKFVKRRTQLCLLIFLPLRFLCDELKIHCALTMCQALNVKHFIYYPKGFQDLELRYI